ncbi:MAG: hypothetical protein MI919_41355, partial [Holophagales bacterium]|nr:hypothetical protein [Holophagales bacterium]
RSRPPGPEARPILERVQQGLDDSTELLAWWRRASQEGRLEESPAVREPQFGNSNFLFLGSAPLDRGLLPVIGLEQDLFFDRIPAPLSRERTSLDWYRKQVREFALRYFMRIATTRSFRAEIEGGSTPRERPVFMDSYQGWGYYQLYFASAETGEVREFLPADRFSIIDLREIGPTYEWVVFKIRFFDFIFQRSLVTADGPRLDIPVTLDTYVVIDSRFVVDREDPAPGVIGEYGFGTPVVPVPDPDSILAYGPGQLATAFQFITFQIRENGEIRARLLLVANLPTRLLNFRPLYLSLDVVDALTLGLASPLLRRLRRGLDRARLPPIPLLFTFTDLANTLSGGLAAYQWCISRQQLYREVMATPYASLEGLIFR